MRKILIANLILVFCLIACNETKEEQKQEFLSLMKNSSGVLFTTWYSKAWQGTKWEGLENECEGIGIYSDGHIYEDYNDCPFVFDKITIYKDDIKEAIYKEASLTSDREHKVRIYTNKYIVLVSSSNEGESELPLAIVTNNEYNKTIKNVNNAKITDLSKKIKLIDFRVCSDRDVERLLKDIDSLSKNEKEELAAMLLIHVYALINDRDVLYNDYRKIKNEQTYINIIKEK